MDEYRNVHTNKDLDRNLLIINNSSMSERQKKNIQKYINERKIGKFGAKAGHRRLANYIQFLNHLHKYFKKDLDKITEKEAEKFYTDLVNDNIRKQNGLPYKEASKDEFVKSLKNYLAWKWGRDSIKYLKSVKWMKDSYKKSKKNAITLEEAKKILDKEKSIRNKAFFMFLFDSGARIEEALNVRLMDLQKTKRKEGGEYLKVHLRGQKTENADRVIAIPLSEELILKWLKEHPQKEEDNFLFPINYDNGRKIIRLMSKRILKYSLKPNELRHSSASHYVSQFSADNIAGFYYRYGWKFGSDIANVYIKSHIYGDKAQEKIIENLEAGRVRKLEGRIEELEKMIKLMNWTKLDEQGNEVKVDVSELKLVSK